MKPCAKHQCGASLLWNAVYDAARIKLLPAVGSKALLILTDGFDSGRSHRWQEAADAVNKADATLYAIPYRSAFGGGLATDLYRLVEETGGTRFRAPNGDYAQIVSRLESDLRRRYVIGFRPDKLGGQGRHEVRIEVMREGFSVRARKSYFQER